MKICQKCGHQNGDNTNFCASCGNSLQNVIPADSQTNTNLDYVPKQQPSENPTFTEDNQQTNYQQQQYDNQQTNYQNRNQKNMWIAVLLDIIGGLIFYFLSGIGQLYLGLYTRGIVLCVTGIVVTIINAVIILTMNEIFGSILSFVIGIALVAYSAYDAYLCTNAINEGRTIPLLFGKLDLH